MCSWLEDALARIIYKSLKNKDIDYSEEIVDLFHVIAVLLIDNPEIYDKLQRKYIEAMHCPNYLDDFEDEWEFAAYFVTSTKV